MATISGGIHTVLQRNIYLFSIIMRAEGRMEAKDSPYYKMFPKGSITAGGTKSCYDIIGVDHSIFTPSFKVDLIFINRLLELSRALPLEHPEYILSKLYNHYLIFVVFLETHFSPDFQQHAINKWLTWNLSLTTEVLYASGRSVVVLSNILDKDTGTALAANRTKFIYVSQSERQSVTLPSWVYDIGRGAKDPSLRVPMLYNKQEIPPTAFRLDYRMMYSDIDENMHVNHLVYFRLSLDAASTAAHQGHFLTYNRSLHDYDVKSMVSLFSKESSVGDDVAVYVWQDDRKDTVIRCVIQCKNVPLFYGDIDFYINTKERFNKSKY